MARVVNPQAGKHLVVASLFWKNARKEEGELPPATRQLMMDAAKLGLVSRFATACGSQKRRRAPTLACHDQPGRPRRLLPFRWKSVVVNAEVGSTHLVARFLAWASVMLSNQDCASSLEPVSLSQMTSSAAASSRIMPGGSFAISWLPSIVPARIA